MVEGLGVIIDVERRIGLRVARLDQPVGGRPAVEIVEALALEALAAAAVTLGIARFAIDRLGAGAFQQRILLDLLGNEGLDLEIRQRQQLDRLLELRRHDERLALPQIEAGTEGHRRYRFTRLASCRRRLASRAVRRIGRGRNRPRSQPSLG